MKLPWMSRDKKQRQNAHTTEPIPLPPSPAPRVVCQTCDCFNGQIRGDGCTGVVDQANGRCAACIDPSVIVDWSQVGVENKCANCGAPHFSPRKYCTTQCAAVGSL